MSCSNKINSHSPTYLPSIIALSKHFVKLQKHLAGRQTPVLAHELSTYAVCVNVSDDSIDPQREVLFICTLFAG